MGIRGFRFFRYTSDSCGKGNTTLYNYDDFGNLTSLQTPNGHTINLTYDANDRRTALNTSGISYSYNYDAKNRLASVTDTNGTISYGYDTLNRVTQITYPGNKTLQFSYDNASNRTSMTYPDSTQASYEYNAVNSIERVTDVTGNVFTLAYNALRQPEALSYPNDIGKTNAYDDLARLTQIEYLANGLTTIKEHNYTYDAVGNIVSQNLGGDTWSYEYDDLNQIASAVLRDSGQSTIFSHNYNYDATGNRTDLTNAATKQYTYDGENRMLTENGIDYSYDNNGNLVSKSTGGATSEIYEYDALNRLTKYTASDGSTTTYKYDPFGRRTEKSSPAEIRKYLWDGIKIICEYDGTDTLADKLTYGNSREILSRRATIAVGTTTTTANYYYHHDHLGSVVMITDSTSSIVNAYNYDDFGNIISSSETIPNDYAYTGKQIDRESGLYYYGARYYDGNTGRFTGKDILEGEIDEPNTLNRYVYVINSPLNFIDEWGLAMKDPSTRRYGDNSVTYEDNYNHVETNPKSATDVSQPVANWGLYTGLIEKLLEFLKLKKPKPTPGNPEACGGGGGGGSGGAGGGGGGGTGTAAAGGSSPDGSRPPVAPDVGKQY